MSGALTQFMTAQHTRDDEHPDVLFEYHCKYWQLRLTPCLTPLIHLPLSFTIPSLLQSMLPVFSILLYWCYIPSPPCILLLLLLPSLPSLIHCLSARVTPTDRCLHFRPYFSVLGLWAVVFLTGLGQRDIKMHEEPYAGERRTISALEISSCITQIQRTLSGSNY